MSLDGWQAALTGYVRKWIGFTADFSGHHGSLDASGAPLSADLNHFSYLFGPRARLLRTRLVSASILALFGASRGTLDASAGVFEGTVFSASVKQTKLAAAVGGAVDINLTRQVAWRVEPVYFLTSFGGERQNNFRFSTGIVYRFGTDWR